VAARYGVLTPAERRVADHLVSAGPEVVLVSAAALAAELGTSDATVVRTAKALGFSGLGELRRALAAQGVEAPLAERLRRTLAEAPGRDELLAATIARHLVALDDLARRVPAERFERAVEVLAESGRILWCGIGPSASLAGYAQLLSQRLGRPSAALTHTGTAFADELLTMREGDAVVVLAYGRVHPHVVVLLDRAERCGVPVVLVTDVLGGRLGARAAAVLECGRGAPGLFASHATTLVLLEALVLAVAAGAPAQAEASLAELNDLRAALAGRRVDVDPA